MGNKQTSAAAIGFFRDDYPNVAPLHILGGTRVRAAACGCGRPALGIQARGVLVYSPLAAPGRAFLASNARLAHVHAWRACWHLAHNPSPMPASVQDMIVPEKEVQGLYDAAYAGDQVRHVSWASAAAARGSRPKQWQCGVGTRLRRAARPWVAAAATTRIATVFWCRLAASAALPLAAARRAGT